MNPPADKPPRMIKVGDADLKYGQFPAQVIAVASPNGPRTRVVLLYVEEGRRRIANDVRRGMGAGCWHLPDEVRASGELP